MLGAGIDVQFAELREAGAAAHRPKAAQGNSRGLGRVWGRCCTNRRQQVRQRTIAPEQEVQQRNPLRVDAMHIEQRVHFLAHQIEG